MIDFIKNDDGYISAYINGKLITSQGHLTSKGLFTNDNDILLSLEEFRDLKLSEFPRNFDMFLMKEIPETNFLMTRVDCITDNMVVEITGDSYSFRNSVWNSSIYLKRFCEFNNHLIIKKLDVDDFENPSIVLNFIKKIDLNATVGEFLDIAFKILKSTNRLIELELKGFKWKEEYISNESLFCKEVLTPLFQKMKLENLEFTHGISEHGKDYVFSERTSLGTIRHSAIQVKAGTLNGRAVSKLKEILEQLDDAFKIPYQQINEEEKKYIDTFYIITSGEITSSAIDKIKNKIQPELKGSVKFLDKHAILRLVNKYWG